MATSVSTQVVDGRQQLVRHGMFFGDFRGKRRALYAQFDGETILADECKCRIEYSKSAVGFEVQRSIECPIDEHKAAALRQQSA